MIDANTVVSAVLHPSGLPRRAIEIARASDMIALSDAVYGEVAEVLTRPKFTRVLTDDRRYEILELLSAAALWAEPKETVQDCRDSKDNRYLELALAVGATAIVSGDEDLLVLHPWRGVQVLRPGEFLSIFGMDGLRPLWRELVDYRQAASRDGPAIAAVPRRGQLSQKDRKSRNNRRVSQGQVAGRSLFWNSLACVDNKHACFLRRVALNLDRRVLR